MLLAARHDVQLAALLRASGAQVSAGIPPTIIASGIRPESMRGRTRAFAEALAADLPGGGSWARAARKARLDPMFGSALEAAEASGRLPEVLGVLAAHVERELRERHELMRPVIYVAACWLIVSVGFPAPLLVTGHPLAWAAIALGLLSLPVIALSLLDAHRRALGALPGLRDVAELRARARWCRAIAMLNATGLPLPATLRLAAEAAALEPVMSAARRVLRTIDAGGSVIDGARREGVLTPSELTMVFDADLTGRMDQAFDRAAEWMEDEARRKVQARAKLLAIFVLVALGIFTFLAMLWGATSFIRDIRDVP